MVERGGLCILSRDGGHKGYILMDIENLDVLDIILYDNSEGGVIVYSRERVVIKGIFL